MFCFCWTCYIVALSSDGLAIFVDAAANKDDLNFSRRLRRLNEPEDEEGVDEEDILEAQMPRSFVKNLPTKLAAFWEVAELKKEKKVYGSLWILAAKHPNPVSPGCESRMWLIPEVAWKLRDSLAPTLGSQHIWQLLPLNALLRSIWIDIALLISPGKRAMRAVLVRSNEV